MKAKINNKLIRSFGSCYDPEEVGISNKESLPVKDWIEKYRNVVKKKEDIIWLVCRSEFMSDRDCRLFAVWCAREALKLIKSPDERSVNACNVAEKFANNQATNEELAAAWDAARDAARIAAWAAAWDAAKDAAYDAAWDAARIAAWAAAWDAAKDAAYDAARDAARIAAWAAAWDAAKDAAYDAAWDAARDAQIDHLLTYFP